MSEELKPCAHCGSKALEIEDHRLRWSVSCKECDVIILGEKSHEPESEDECSHIDWDSIRQTAVDRWNSRHTTQSQVDEYLAEKGMVAVPVELTDSKLRGIQRKTEAQLGTYVCSEWAHSFYKLMIQAAQTQGDV